VRARPEVPTVGRVLTVVGAAKPESFWTVRAAKEGATHVASDPH
jgi:hypothetical protein